MKRANILTTTITCIILFLSVSLAFDVLFCLNDDLMIQGIISGTFSGRPNPYAVYLNSPFSHAFAGLYSLFPGIPWFGMFLAGSYLACFALIHYRILSLTEVLRNRILFTVAAVVIFLCLFFSNFILIHYTVTAALLGGTGFFLLATAPARDTKKETFVSMLPAIILLLLCYQVRTNVFFMMMPFTLVAFLARKTLYSKEMKKAFLNHLPAMGVFAGAFLLLFALNTLLYHTGEMKEYTRFNDARTNLYDFVLFHDSEPATLYYTSHGMTPEELPVYHRYNILLDESASPEKFDQMASYLKDTNQELSLSEKIRLAVSTYKARSLYPTEDFPYNYLAFAFYILVIAAIISNRKWYAFCPLALTFFFRSLLFFYLFYKGRFPERVTLSVFLAEFLCLCAILFITAIKSPKQTTVFASILIAMVIPVGLSTIPRAISLYEYQKTINTNQEGLFAYFREHPDNLYLLDVYSAVYRTEYAIKDYDDSYENYLTLGGWVSAHPIVDEKLASHGFANIKDAITTGDNVYVVLHESKGMTKEELEAYYPEISFLLQTTISLPEDTFYVYQGKTE